MLVVVFFIKVLYLDLENRSNSEGVLVDVFEGFGCVGFTCASMVGCSVRGLLSGCFDGNRVFGLRVIFVCCCF